MSEERRTWAEEDEVFRQRQLDECPPELRPWMRRFQEANQAMMAVLAQPNRLRYAITYLEERLLSSSDAEESSALRNALERYDAELVEAERVLTSAKEAAVAASEAFQDALIEWRIRLVPEGRLEEAKTLLREERARIESLYEAAPATGEVYGAAAMETLRYSALLSKARRSGDQEGASRHEADLTAARAHFAELQSPLETHKQAQQDLKGEYERRLQALVEDVPAA